MRIVSLIPACTEWVGVCGAADALVGRSHECDEPLSVQALPALTRPSFASAADSAAIDASVQDRLRRGLSLYDVDLDRLRALEPDVVLTQAQCEVCAATLPQIEDALAAWTGARPTVFSMEPQTLKEVLDAGLRLGKTIGRPEAAMRQIGEAEQRLARLQRRLGLTRTAETDAWPSVACIEWMEPLMTAGHWMPDVVEQAGGRAVLAQKGAPSSYVSWDALRAADPDVLAVIPCGFTLEQTIRDLPYLTERDGWRDLRAVRTGRVYLFDGNAYFNRPSLRLYRAIELLAHALRPDALPAHTLNLASWEMAPGLDVPSEAR